MVKLIFNMKKYYVLLLLLTLSIQNSVAQNYQQNVRDFVEGKYFKNQQTGRSIKYGYISSLNTYGLTFKDNEGKTAYFIDCNSSFSSDEQFMELTSCMNPNTGSTLGTFGVYKDRIVMYGNDGKLTFYLEKEVSVNENNYTPEIKQSSSFIDGDGGSTKKDKSVVPSLILGNTRKIGKIEIAQNDFAWEMNFDEAQKVCEKLGKGWRLPTKDELNIIYKNKLLLRAKVNKYSNAPYWTSTKFNEYSSDYYWYLNMENGKFEAYTDKSAWFRVRAVRDL